MDFVYCFISIHKAILWSLAALMCYRQHDRSTVRRHMHCRARLELPSLPRARSCALKRKACTLDPPSSSRNHTSTLLLARDRVFIFFDTLPSYQPRQTSTSPLNHMETWSPSYGMMGRSKTETHRHTYTHGHTDTQTHRRTW